MASAVGLSALFILVACAPVYSRADSSVCSDDGANGACFREGAALQQARRSTANIGTSEVLLLQKQYSTSLTSCHTAIEGEQCYTGVKWAMRFGIRLHPLWYPELSKSSSFEEFQSVLHSRRIDGCPQPCAPGAGGKGLKTSLDSTPGKDGTSNMGVCQGDCDDDSDCAGSLRCFQRDDTSPVPGCKGRGNDGWDYCYQPPPPPFGEPHEVPYDPCAGKNEGSTCTLCAPEDVDCMETTIVKICQRGRCEAALVTDSTSKPVKTTSTTTTTTCHTAIKGEDPCYRWVEWAKDVGVKQSPQWYPEQLRSSTKFEDFQDYLHSKGLPKFEPCPKPCATPTASQPAETTTLDTATQSTTPVSTTRAATASTTADTTEGATIHKTSVRLMTFNVYFAALGTASRLEGVSSSVADISADIAVITGLWNEKSDLLGKVREMSGRNYKFCDGGEQDRYWDGDIMYDADAWEAVEDNVIGIGMQRGFNWALLRNKATSVDFLVYGAHAVCCANEKLRLDSASAIASEIHVHKKQWPEASVFVMGDFNAAQDAMSIQYLKGEHVSGSGETSHSQFALRDTFEIPAENRNANAATTLKGEKFDYIFVDASSRVVEVERSTVIREAVGGSTHFPIVTDVLITR